jgi:hypothetical protein
MLHNLRFTFQKKKKCRLFHILRPYFFCFCSSPAVSGQRRVLTFSGPHVLEDYVDQDVSTLESKGITLLRNVGIRLSV